MLETSWGPRPRIWPLQGHGSISDQGIKIPWLTLAGNKTNKKKLLSKQEIFDMVYILGMKLEMGIYFSS